MSRKLYIGNLSKETTDAELEEFFSIFGTVISARIKKDKVTSEPWGYGFVIMETDEGTEMALHDAEGQELHERPMKIHEMPSL